MTKCNLFKCSNVNNILIKKTHFNFQSMNNFIEYNIFNASIIIVPLMIAFRYQFFIQERDSKVHKVNKSPSKSRDKPNISSFQI